MRKYIIYSVAIFIFFLSSCSSEDVELTRTVFIEDKMSPGLPIYSEWGYNSFGAYIDRIAFISADEMPAKIIVNVDTFNLTIKGKMGDSPISMKFSIVGLSPADYPDLIMLNDSTINLKDESCTVTLTKNGEEKRLQIIDGLLHFKRAQKLYVDNQLTKTILSGEFRFRTFMDKTPIAITNGRFDFGIGYDNFYNY